MLASALGFSVMTLSVKLLGERLPTFEIVLVRGAINAIVTLALLRALRVAPWGNRRGALALRGTFGFAALACFYAATIRLPLAEVTVLHYTNPIVTALVAAFWLKERAGGRVVAGLVAGLLGVVALAAPWRTGSATLLRPDLPWIGVALASAVLAALAYVTVRDLRRTEHPLVVVLWFSGAMILLSAVPAAAQWVPPTPKEWGILLLVGASAQVGQIFVTLGLSALPAGRAMAIGYVQVAFAAGWGLLFFGTVPEIATVLGIGLIVGGALLANAGPVGDGVRWAVSRGARGLRGR